MALRVWLPLNGTLENKGISDVTVTNNGATVDNNGKIGKCYSFGTDKYLKLNNYAATFLTYNEFSLSVWFKCTVQNTAHQGSALISAGNWNQADSLLILALGGNFSTDHYTRLLVSGSGTWSNGYDYNFYLNQWYNVVLTSGNGKVRAYVNGELIGDSYAAFKPASLAQDWVCIGNGTYVQIFHFIGLMNDVRIYDHCLSAKEVKEISQGLVLHYKLDGWSGGAGENLLSKYVTPGQQNPGATSSAGRTNYYGDYGIIIPASENADTYFRLFTNTQLQQNAQYTISCEASGLSSGTYYNFPLYAQNNTSMGVLRIDHNGICSLTFTMTYATQTAMTVDGKTVYLCFMDDSARTLASGQGAITIKNFKIEKGSKATSWSPALEDLGIDTTKITDSSGYEYDGVVTGALKIEQNSDRYNASSYFNGSSYITISNPWKSGSIVTEFTHTAWIKWNSNCSTSSGIHSIAGGNSFFRFALGKSNKLWAYGLRSSLNGETTSAAGLGQYGSTTNLVNGQWYFIAVTFKNGVCKCYCDGELAGTVDNSATYPALKSTIDNLYIGSHNGGGEFAIGNVADSRMYCTALSAEDILDLYHTSASVDNEKRLHSFELVEDDGNRVDEQGLVHSGLLSSDSDLIKLLYDKKLHIEPDGSVWAHIYHHNRPDLGSFSSTNDFANSVKIDDNRWFNATEIVNSFSSEWEFLIIYNFTQGGTVYKERWIQTKNPETAVFGDVDAADITRVTGGEYKTGTWGGLYKKNGSAYWVMNNGTNGNWWGATGSFSIYQGGIPGYGGSITTTGCNDLYIRIDRFSSTPTQASIGRGSVYIFNDFIEK